MICDAVTATGVLSERGRRRRVGAWCPVLVSESWTGSGLNIWHQQPPGLRYPVPVQLEQPRQELNNPSDCLK